MDNNENKKENKFQGLISKASNIGKKATDIGKKATDEISKGAKTLVEKTKSDMLARRIKKYNPLFAKEYKSKAFNRPNMIMIVDDAVRRDIDVCEGAIGWRGYEGEIEVLFLYDEFVSKSGVTFVPAPSCDAVYYVDNYDRNRFIRVDCVFSKAHEEKMAEIEHIAYSLSAKSFSVEIVEEMSEATHKNIKTAVKSKAVKESTEIDLENTSSNMRRGVSNTIFEGHNSPVRPNLKWFAQDDTILNLIDMRCKDPNSIKTRTLSLMGASSATMSQKTACSIDSALSKIGSASGNMEKQATREYQSKLIYEIVF